MRLPLTGVYNTRPGTGALTGALGVVGVGVVGVMIVGNNTQGSSKDHRLVNRLQITETDENAQSKRLYLPKRPGFAASLTVRSGHIGNAIRVWAGQGSGTKVMSCFGNTNFKLFDSTTDKGDGTGKATFITETSVSGTPTLTITADDSSAWYYQDGGALTEITDAQYPGNDGRTTTGPLVHLDGYAFQMDTTGRIYNSDLNSVSAWTSNSYITANSIPDVGIAAIRSGSTIIGFCKEHFDVFRNAGNPSGSPLSRVEELSKFVGCISPHAICQIRDVVYFIGSTRGANLALYAYSGGQLQKLSTAEIDAAMAIAGPSNITLSQPGFYGRHHIWISAASSTFGYCVEEKTWYEVSGANLWYKTNGVASGSTITTYSISKASTSGKVYVLNPGAVVYKDDGMSYTSIVQTAKWDGGSSKKKTCKTIGIVGDQEASTAVLNVAWSDDDYQTFSTPRQVDMSEDSPKLTRCGRFKRRAFLLTDSADAAMRLEALDVEVEEGAT